MHNQPKVFLSGGFKSDWQSQVINQLGDSFVFFNPREHNLDDPANYTTWDIHFVKDCDILFAHMESTNPSGYGLAFELGLAYALNKTIILVDERSNVDPVFSNYFKILHNAASSMFNNLDAGIAYLKKFSTQNKSKTL